MRVSSPRSIRVLSVLIFVFAMISSAATALAAPADRSPQATAVTVTIDDYSPPTNDNVVYTNNREPTISGTTVGVPDGTTLTMTDQLLPNYSVDSYTTTVYSNQWSIDTSQVPTYTPTGCYPSGCIEVMNEGAYTITAQVTTGGVTYSAAPQTLYEDYSAQAVSITSPTSDQVFATSTPTFTAVTTPSSSGEYANVVSVAFDVQTTSSTTSTWTTIGTSTNGSAQSDGTTLWSVTANPGQNGPYVVRARALDQANNEGTSSLVSFGMDDPNAPSVTFSPSTVTPGAPITVSGKTVNPQATSVTVTLVDDNGNVVSTLGTAPVTNGQYSKVFDVPGNLPAGIYHVQVSDGTNTLTSSTAVTVPTCTTIGGTISADQTLDGPCYYVTSNLTVASGVRLYIQPGVTLLFNNYVGLNVDGELDAYGNQKVDNTPVAPPEPVIFTSSAGTPPNGAWTGINFRSTSKGTLQYVTVKYAGYYYDYGIRVGDNSTPLLNEVTVDHTGGYGIDLEGTGCPTILGTTVLNSPYAGLYWNGCSTPTLSGLTFQNTGDSDRIRLNSAALSNGGTLPAAGPDYLVTSNLTVNPGFTLTIDPGVTVRFNNYVGLTVDGSLEAQGTVTAPIIFSAADEGSNTSPGPWNGITFDSASGSAMQYVTIKYAGWTGSAILVNGSGAPAFDNLTINHTGGTGVTFAGTGSPVMTSSTVSNSSSDGVRVASGCPTLTNLTVSNNLGHGLSLALDPGIHCDLGLTGSLTSTGNQYNAIALAGGAVSSSGTIYYYGPDYQVTSNISVPAGVTLNVNPGATVGFNGYTGLSVDGTLNALGDKMANNTPISPPEPITFSSNATNTVWTGITFTSTGAGTLRYVTLERGGWSGAAILVSGSTDMNWDHLTLLNSSGNGLQVDGTAVVSVPSSNFENGTSGVGVTNNGGTVDACGSWWNSTTGPTIGSNPGGTGNHINGTRATYVKYGSPDGCSFSTTPITVTSTSSSPSVSFTPSSVVQGASISVSGSNFSTSATSATVRLVDPTNTATVVATLGTAPLNSGAFSNASFTITNTVAVSTYKVQVTDGTNTATSSTTLSVTAANQAPVVTSPGDQSSAEGAAVSLPIKASDPDGDTLTYSATNLPTGLSIDASTGVISGTIDYTAAAKSPYAVTVTASDGTLTGSASFSWTVSNTNQAPQFDGSTPADGKSYDVTVGSPVSFSLSASDPDAGDVVTLGIGGAPAAASSNLTSGNPATGTFSWTPTAAGTTTLTLTAQDQSGSSAPSRTVTINASAAPTATVSLNPSNTTVGLNRTADVAIQVNAGSQSVDGAEIHLDFDPTKLQVVDSNGNPVTSVPLGTALTLQLQNQVDNANGHIDLAVGANFGTTPPTGTFTVATVTFKAIGATTTGSTPLTFSLTSPRKTDLTSNGTSIFGGATDGSVTVLPDPILNGSVSLQGRGNVGDPRWQVPLHVKLFQPGTSTLVAQYDTTTDTSGNFQVTLAGVSVGSYDVEVKQAQAISRKASNVNFAAGSNPTIDFGTLHTGDVNDDNQVAIVDFSILRGVFGKQSTDSGYDARADLEVDNLIDTLDFSWLRTNFGQTGPLGTSVLAAPANQTTSPSKVSSGKGKPTPTGSTSLTLQTPKGQPAIGDVFSVDVLLDSGSQPVDGTQFRLTFDPTVLQVVDGNGNPSSTITAGTTFDSVLANQVDNAQGQIHFAAGDLNGSLPSGQIKVATITFKAIAATDSHGTTLAFGGSGADRTLVTSGGSALSETTTDATIVVKSSVGKKNKATPTPTNPAAPAMTATPEPTTTPTPTPIASVSPSPSPTGTPTTANPTATATPSASATIPASPTVTPTVTATTAVTASPSRTPSPSPTATVSSSTTASSAKSSAGHATH